MFADLHLRREIGFQLHHTGIKTRAQQKKRDFFMYFNCTIQELKRKQACVVVLYTPISIAPYRN